MVAERRKEQVRKAIVAAENYMAVEQGKKGF
jgi:hypothetical protein